MSGPACVLWPDRVPKICPKDNGKLKYILPVYQRYGAWYWLAECECGGETIVRTPSNAKSCGCLQRAGKTVEPVAVDNRFNRGKFCIRRSSSGYVFECKHYVACLTERVEEELKYSRRYTKYEGGCYEAGDLELEVIG